MPEHIAESLSYGTFFIGLALVQGLYGVTLLRWRSPRIVMLGAWGTLAVIISYAVMRSAQATFGPHGEHVSTFEVLAMLCSAMELGLLFSLLLDVEKVFYTAEALFFGLALTHLWVAQERYGEWWGYGLFFLVVGVGQGLYSLGLSRLRSRASFLIVGIVGNLAVISTWILTHTVGIPYVRTTSIESSELRIGKTEGVGIVDLAATTIELALVVILLMLLIDRYRTDKTPNRSVKEPGQLTIAR